MLKGEEFMRHITWRMVEYNFEPTLEDFADWIKDDEDIGKEAKAFTDERRKHFQQLLAAGASFSELTNELTEDELYDWYRHIDILIDYNRPFP